MQPKRVRTSLKIGVGLVLLVATSVVFAQDTPAPEDDGAVTVPMEKQARLSPSDMVEQSELILKKMQAALQQIVGLQQVARKQKDVIKLNCVNDKLLQVKQLLNIAEGAKTNMLEAIAQEDEGARYHEFGKVVIAEQQVSVLLGEAENCIGEELVFLGPTEVDVEEPDEPIDPTEPDDDYIDDPELEQPPVASPFS